MSNKPTYSFTPASRMIDGPSNLLYPVRGEGEIEDEILRRYQENNDFSVVDIYDISHTEVLLESLIEYNKSQGNPPLLPVPISVHLIDSQTQDKLSSPFGEPITFKLDLESDPDNQYRSYYTLRRVVQIDEKTAHPVEETGYSRFLNIVENGSLVDIEIFLKEILIEREAALIHLRRLTDAHRDSVQNAVDIVQTKRIDFLENPQEVGVLGSMMAFVVAQLIEGLIIGPGAGLVVTLITQGVLTIIGGSKKGFPLKSTISAFINSRKEGFITAINKIDKAKKELNKINSRKNVKNLEKIKKIQEKINILRKEYGFSEKKKEYDLFKLIILDSENRVKKTALQDKKFFKDAEEKISEYAAEKALKNPSQIKADQNEKESIIPIDVAMKLEVQNYFDSWIAAAEYSIILLKKIQLSSSTRGSDLFLLDEHIDIQWLFDFNNEIDNFTNDVSKLVLNYEDIRAEMTNFYELLLWLMMYKQSLSKPHTEMSKFDREGFMYEYDAVPDNEGTRNLLRYLAVRFLKKGKINKAGELEINEKDLLETHRYTINLSNKISGNMQAIQNISTIQFGLMSYEKMSYEKKQ